MKIKNAYLILFFFNYISAEDSENSAQKVFSEIYEKKIWGVNYEGIGRSGGGSKVSVTIQYREFIETFLSKYGIKTVVDLGCGDWEFSRFINWNGINYIGIDVVPSVIERDQKKHEKNNIHFLLMDALEQELPEADLLICKDVLQHLTNEDIIKISKQFSKYKYCLITNGIDSNTLSSDNYDIMRGDYRPLDLTKPPFSFEGNKILTYSTGAFLMQILLIENH